MSKQVLPTNLPKPGKFKSLLVFAVLLAIVVTWPQESAAATRETVESLQVFFARLDGGGRS